MKDQPAMTKILDAALRERFGDAAPAPTALAEHAGLAALAARGSTRAFSDRPVDRATLHTLCAVALSAPTKSDLQQRDIVIVEDPARRAALQALIPDAPWAADAAALLVFCGNHARQRRLHRLRGHAFANDHFDAPFNAACDAAIALAAFVAAADLVGLGTCPISAVRNRAQETSDLLDLPDHVFPMAGLAVGWPAADAPTIAMRLPLAATVHIDRYRDTDADARIKAYDERRRAAQPHATQRDEARFGRSAVYGWSEDKARQYAAAERSDFGAFMRARGFKMD